MSVHSPSNFSEKQKGELAAFGAALLWSLFPIVTVLTVSALPPLYSAAIGTTLAALFFACMMVWRNHWSQLQRRAAWKDMLLATFFIGIVFYALMFIGYRFTSPGNGALVSLMEIFFTFVVVNLLWRHERFVPQHALGGACMFLGAALILLPDRAGEWNVGDIFILLATLSAPIGNIYAQRARRLVSADTLMFVRSVLSALFLFALAALLEPMPDVSAVGASFWLLLLNGVLLLGLSKILWLEAIHRLSIAKTIALTAVEVLLTLALAYVLLGQAITTEQALGVVPMLLGVFLLTRK